MYKQMKEYKDKFEQIQQENSVLKMENLKLVASKSNTLQYAQGDPTTNLANVLEDVNLKELQLSTLITWYSKEKRRYYYRIGRYQRKIIERRRLGNQNTGRKGFIKGD